MKVLHTWDKKLQLYTLRQQSSKSRGNAEGFHLFVRHVPSKYQLSTSCAQARLPGTARGPARGVLQASEGGICGLFYVLLLLFFGQPS